MDHAIFPIFKLGDELVFGLKSVDIQEEVIETGPHIEHECLELFDILNRMPMMDEC